MSRFRHMPALAVMTVYLLTLGLFMFPWCWEQWRYYSRSRDVDVSALVRALFYPLFLPSLMLLLSAETGAQKRWRDFLSLLSLFVLVLHLVALLEAIVGVRVGCAGLANFIITLVLMVLWQRRVNIENRDQGQHP